MSVFFCYILEVFLVWFEFIWVLWEGEYCPYCVFFAHLRSSPASLILLHGPTVHLERSSIRFPLTHCFSSHIKTSLVLAQKTKPNPPTLGSFRKYIHIKERGIFFTYVQQNNTQRYLLRNICIIFSSHLFLCCTFFLPEFDFFVQASSFSIFPDNVISITILVRVNL